MRTIARCSDITQAHSIKMLLGGNGIEAFIPDENVAAVAPYLFSTRSGVRVQVNEKDEKVAKKIISEYKDSL
jgi:hypothetical protein